MRSTTDHAFSNTSLIKELPPHPDLCSFSNHPSQENIQKRNIAVWKLNINYYQQCNHSFFFLPPLLDVQSCDEKGKNIIREKKSKLIAVYVSILDWDKIFKQRMNDQLIL